MVRKIILVILALGLSILTILACSERNTNPVEGTTNTGAYGPTDNPAGFFALVTAPSGGPFSLAAGMAVVDHTDPDARISCEFATVIDSTTLDSAFTLVTSSGTDIALDFAMGVGTNTIINITPSADLSYNTTYILTLKSALLLNTAGDMLDVDGDEIGGETPDDDIVLRFTTFHRGDSFDDRDNDDTYDNLTDVNGDHIWETSGVGEAFTDTRPYNHVWDTGETFTDANGNGKYDIGERFYDNNGDSVYNSNAETLMDSNSNGFADLGEFFTDADNDSVWDDAESYTDANSNGEWDNTELRLDWDADGIYEPADGDTYSDIETVNGICDYAEAFTNTDNDSVAGLAWDSLGVHYIVPHWDDAEAVTGGYDYDNDGEYDAGTYLLPSGTEAFDPTSVILRQVYYNGSWQNLRFAGFTETFTDANADSVWNPADTFEDHIANGVWDAVPETLITDLNGNGQYDAPVAGIPVPLTEDDIPPTVISGVYHLIGSNIVGTVWMDASIAIDIADSAYDAAGARIEQALPSDVFNTTTVIVRDQDTKNLVSGTVTYDNVATSATYLRLLFDPASNLAAGKTYEAVLKAQQIADTAGNKLNETTDVIYTFTTVNRTSDGSVIVDDVTPPAVTNFVDNGLSFTVTFSEEIDVTTINAATIAVTWAGLPNEGSYIIDRIAAGGAPTGFATVVTFIPADLNRNGDTAIIKASIKDLAGNRKGADNTYNW